MLEKQLFHGGVEKDEILNTGWGQPKTQNVRDAVFVQMQPHKMTHLEDEDRMG